MKPFLVKIILISIHLLFVGCGTKKESQVEEIFGFDFQENKGLKFSPETEKVLGVEIIDVSNQAFVQGLKKTAHIYRESGESSASEYMRQGFAYASSTLFLDELDHVRMGQNSELKNFPALSGTVIRVDRQMEKQTGQVEILIEIRDPTHLLKVGDSLEIEFPLQKSEEERVVIPRSALLKSASGTFVYVVNGEHFFRTPVKVGSETDEAIEIKEGLYPGDQVVKQPVLKLWLAELQATKAGQPCCILP